ncbi:MAG: DinB family protein [Nitrospinota bacterium]
MEGLTEAQLDRVRPEKGWGAWSIRVQVSHTAWIPYLFFLDLLAPVFFPDGRLPRDKSLASAGGADRRLDPARFHAMPGLLAALGDGCALAREILARETPASLQREAARPVPRGRRWANGESVAAYWENLVLPAHPDGLRRDPARPEVVHQTLGCAFRHILWEALVHLKTIQAHKRAEGLPPCAEVPEVGYIPRLAWD